jgi:hypothetical protein
VLEALWINLGQRINVVLEKGCQFGPQNHAHTVVKQVKDRDFDCHLHQVPKLFVELNAQKERKYV